MNNTRLISLAVSLLITIAWSANGFAQRTERGAKSGAPPLPQPVDFAFPGEIRAFAGSSCPANWLVADGRELDDSGHKGLVAAIGDLWGSSAVGKFKIPDLRGVFLRGWNQGRAPESGDPDAQKRDIPKGAPIDPNLQGDQIGTTQSDQFHNHSHTTTATARWGDKYADTIGFGADNGQHPAGAFSLNTSVNGGTETRPKNVYVLFCIRDAN